MIDRCPCGTVCHCHLCRICQCVGRCVMIVSCCPDTLSCYAGGMHCIPERASDVVGTVQAHTRHRESLLLLYNPHNTRSSFWYAMHATCGVCTNATTPSQNGKASACSLQLSSMHVQNHLTPTCCCSLSGDGTCCHMLCQSCWRP